MSPEDIDQLKRKIYQLENQISALSDQVWALMRDGKDRMSSLCDQIDANAPMTESDVHFVRGMLGCILAELSCREANN